MNRDYVFLIALIALSLVGCGSDGPDLALVTGTVTYKGKPVEGGSLEFIPEAGGRPSMAITDETGQYAVYYTKDKPGAVIGKHTIRFQMNIAAGRVPEEEQFSPPASKKDVPKNVSLRPDSVEIVDGKNEIDFELASKT